MSSHTYISAAYQGKEVQEGVIFATFLSAFNSDIQKENRKSHVKMYQFILFYFIKKSEMK